MHIRIIDIRPPRIALLFVLTAQAIHWSIPKQHIYLFSHHISALLLGAAGIAIMIRAWLLFKQRNIALPPKADTRSLITDGIYRFTRNPMYLGMTMALSAMALYHGTAGFYAAAAAFFTVVNRVFCPYEEEKLAASFGDQYQAYARSVRRWM